MHCGTIFGIAKQKICALHHEFSEGRDLFRIVKFLRLDDRVTERRRAFGQRTCRVIAAEATICAVRGGKRSPDRRRTVRTGRRSDLRMDPGHACDVWPPGRDHRFTGQTSGYDGAGCAANALDCVRTRSPDRCGPPTSSRRSTRRSARSKDAARRLIIRSARAGRGRPAMPARMRAYPLPARRAAHPPGAARRPPAIPHRRAFRTKPSRTRND